MSTTINPDGTLVARNDASTYQIQSSTSASPIVLTLGVATTVQEGDYLEVTGHQINTNANGTWKAHVVASNQIALVGSTGNGVGAISGYMRDFSITPQVQVPSTGDAATAASVATGMSADLAPIMPFSMRRAGNWRVHSYYNSSSGNGPYYSPPVPNTNYATAWWTASGVPAGSQVTFAPPLALLDIPTGENLLFDVRFTGSFNSASGVPFLIIPVIQPNSGTGFLYLWQNAQLVSAGAGAFTPVNLSFVQLIGSGYFPAPYSGGCCATVAVFNTQSGSQTFSGLGPAQMSVCIYRSF